MKRCSRRGFLVFYALVVAAIYIQEVLADPMPEPNPLVSSSFAGKPKPPEVRRTVSMGVASPATAADTRSISSNRRGVTINDATGRVSVTGRKKGNHPSQTNSRNTKQAMIKVNRTAARERFATAIYNLNPANKKVATSPQQQRSRTIDDKRRKRPVVRKQIQDKHLIDSLTLDLPSAEEPHVRFGRKIQSENKPSANAATVGDDVNNDKAKGTEEPPASEPEQGQGSPVDGGAVVETGFEASVNDDTLSRDGTITIEKNPKNKKQKSYTEISHGAALALCSKVDKTSRNAKVKGKPRSYLLAPIYQHAPLLGRGFPLAPPTFAVNCLKWRLKPCHGHVRDPLTKPCTFWAPMHLKSKDCATTAAIFTYASNLVQGRPKEYTEKFCPCRYPCMPQFDPIQHCLPLKDAMGALGNTSIAADSAAAGESGANGAIASSAGTGSAGAAASSISISPKAMPIFATSGHPARETIIPEYKTLQLCKSVSSLNPRGYKSGLVEVNYVPIRIRSLAGGVASSGSVACVAWKWNPCMNIRKQKGCNSWVQAKSANCQGEQVVSPAAKRVDKVKPCPGGWPCHFEHNSTSRSRPKRALPGAAFEDYSMEELFSKTLNSRAARLQGRTSGDKSDPDVSVNIPEKVTKKPGKPLPSDLDVDANIPGKVTKKPGKPSKPDIHAHIPGKVTKKPKPGVNEKAKSAAAALESLMRNEAYGGRDPDCPCDLPCLPFFDPVNKCYSVDDELLVDAKGKPIALPRQFSVKQTQLVLCMSYLDRDDIDCNIKSLENSPR